MYCAVFRLEVAATTPRIITFLHQEHPISQAATARLFASCTAESVCVELNDINTSIPRGISTIDDN